MLPVFANVFIFTPLFFNGLGSKGSLRAPWLARHLAEHLLDGRLLEPEFDLQANDPT